jgi:signal transduction histidine kinase
VEVAIARIERAGGAVYTAAFRSRSQLLHLPDAGRLKSDFLANMSHELRSPLNVIIGFAKLMYRGRVGDVTDPQREYLGDILDSGEHLLSLIDDLVQLSKLEAGRIELRAESVNLSLLLHEVHESLESLARTKQVTLVTDAEPDCEVELDPDKLRQVLINLLTDVLKVTPDGGSLQLQARLVEDEQAYFELTGGKTFAAQAPDMGLRSVLTERLVEQQGGRIGVCQERSSLYVQLPCRLVTTRMNPLPPLGAT